MSRAALCLAAMLLIADVPGMALAQTTAPAPAATISGSPAAKPSRVRLTIEKLKEMKARWTANRPRLKACRKEVKTKGLVGDERWFFIEDCMEKT
ncbi:hypothetical protein [Bradyrhizobium sp. dw_78]|uniref:hypothetical protein n=1 Tax=Bradyrhizobium sp. dw_78 TaxID=2719793 RepID=UPI001BD58FB8|nr:hypothetical protein [Bradyrhizobium sp. dw_78]